MKSNQPPFAPQYPSVFDLPIALLCCALVAGGLYGSAALGELIADMAPRAIHWWVYAAIEITWVVGFGLAACWAYKRQPRRRLTFILCGAIAGSAVLNALAGVVGLLG